MSEADEVLGGHAAGRLGVARYAGPRAVRLIDQDDVESLERFCAKRGGGRRVDDDAVDLACAKGFEMARRAVSMPVTEQQGVSLFGGDPFGAAGNVGKEGVAEIGDDESERIRPPANETLGEEVRAIAEFFGGREHAFPGLERDARRGVPGEHEAHRGLGDPGFFGDVVRGDRGLVGLGHVANTYWQSWIVKGIWCLGVFGGFRSGSRKTADQSPKRDRSWVGVVLANMRRCNALSCCRLDPLNPPDPSNPSNPSHPAKAIADLTE